jgi:hypothetical protein
MKRNKRPYCILLIDDDSEANEILSRSLGGMTLLIENIEIIVEVEILNIELESNPNHKDHNKISIETLRSLWDLTRDQNHDLVIIDYGYAPKDAQEELWKVRGKPSQDLVERLKFNLLDLSTQYMQFIHATLGTKCDKQNVFLTAKNVIMRSMKIDKMQDVMGPFEQRIKVTRRAFPKVENLIAFDPRQTLYGTDEFYQFYNCDKGRDFYRYLVGAFTAKMVEAEIRKKYSKNNKMTIRKSVFNIALFAGSVAIIGMSVQFVSSIGINLLQDKNSIGWWVILFGLSIQIIGAFMLAIGFEHFSGKVIQWVKHDDEL